MIGFGTSPQAWGLTHGMARVQGVSLPGAVIEGWLRRSEVAALLERCQACGKSVACADWLVTAKAAEALPGYCRNKTEIESLAG